jgi:hypothetical protein
MLWSAREVGKYWNFPKKPVFFGSGCMVSAEMAAMDSLVPLATPVTEVVVVVVVESLA